MGNLIIVALGRNLRLWLMVPVLRWGTYGWLLNLHGGQNLQNFLDVGGGLPT